MVPVSRPSVNNSVFSISFLITWPTKLKLRRVILDIGAQSRSVPDFAISSQEALWGARFLKSSIFISSFIAWPTKLKHCRVILDIGAHSHSVPDFAILQEARLWKSSNRFTAYSIHPIELELDRMIRDISPEAEFFDFIPRGRCGGAPLAIHKSVHGLQFLCDSAETW